MDITQRLRQAIHDAHGIPPLEPDILQLCHDALAEIERLNAGPSHRVCVHTPVGGYPHESGCVGCRIQKTCYKCGHYVDLSSKHR